MPEELTDSNEMYEHYRFAADKGQKPLRIDKFLQNKLEGTSRNRIQAAATAGSILANNTPVKANYKVKPNDAITIVLPHPPRKLELIPENIPVDIVYEDPDLLVINKKPGMVVHPGHGNYTGTMVNALMYHLKDNPLFQSGEERPGLVHRIDKNTSGLLVVAKTADAMAHLALQFFNKTTKRTYNALVWGNLDDEEGTITGNIGRNPKDRKKMMVFPGGEQGKEAITHYTVLERLGYVNLVECRLETGRTHQIRVHFKYIKHPLFNDNEYGGNSILRGTTFTKYKQFVNNCFKILPRQALHATSLGFIHPSTGKDMYFKSPLPDDITTVVDRWRTYITGRKEI
ncbi:MAG TPA: RluA family pseudouridine synthase [Bacteroidales bacterium]|nr:RluA family pseudouridine synthase [Bacteroidales bacterium]